MAFERDASGRAVACLLDVAEKGTVATTIEGVEREVGAMDVLVNNAGFGLEGTIEESSLGDAGAVRGQRVRRRRHDQSRRPWHACAAPRRILNVTSMGALTTFVGLGFYQASKFALEGLTETLAKEVKAFGIHVTAVAPGGFRTDKAGRSLVRAPRSIADYDTLVDPVYAARLARNGQQIGDPTKAAATMLRLVDSPNPPVHAILGSDAVRFVGEKLAAWRPNYRPGATLPCRRTAYRPDERRRRLPTHSRIRLDVAAIRGNARRLRASCADNNQ